MSKSNLKSQKLGAMRHSCEHVLHQAMVELFPGLKRAMGPATAEGFYHDFDYKGKIGEEDFPKIEKKMKEIIRADLPIIRQEISIAAARKLFQDNPYKQDWLDKIAKSDEKPMVYWTGAVDKPGSDVDLCKGPHVASTGKIGPFKLLSLAGAYWHGDEKNKMLTRIYGTCFTNQKELDQYLWQQQEAKKRDHKKLGEKLELFFLDEVAPGMPFWQPKGMILRNILFDRWKKIQAKYGYGEVLSPNMLDTKVFKQSGHWDHYKDDMFFTKGKGGRQYALRPMDCPGEIQIYKHRPHSYKELPIKFSEIGTVVRNEKSGELNGLFRVAQITQDDAHVFMREDQIKEQIKEVVKITQEIYAPFDLDYKVYLATRPDDYMGDKKVWDKAEKTLKEVMEEFKLPVLIKEKGGAFYGPKLDYEVKDSLGRTWQCATIQLDFFMPEKFALEYIGQDGKKHRPVMCHRALMGSIERFIGILIEHYAAAFPLWLAPVQVMIIPISEKQNDYAAKIKTSLQAENLRVEIDDRAETMQKKIKEAEEQKIPYMLIIGAREKEAQKISVRARGEKDLGLMDLKAFLDKIKQGLEEKK